MDVEKRGAATWELALKSIMVSLTQVVISLLMVMISVSF
jgi:hypothetical protein